MSDEYPPQTTTGDEIYVVGQFPPARRSNVAAMQAFAGLLRAHGAAYRALRSASSTARIGAPGMVRNEPGPGDRNDLGWEIFPAGLTRLVEEAQQRYHLPIYITENGMPDASDKKSGPFLAAHISAVARAIGGGADVRSPTSGAETFAALARQLR